MFFGKKKPADDAEALELTADNIKKSDEKVYQQIFDAGVKSVDTNAVILVERRRISDILSSVKNVSLLTEAMKQIEAGKSASEAASALLIEANTQLEKLQAQNDFYKGAAQQVPGASVQNVTSIEDPANRWEKDSVIQKVYKGDRESFIKSMAKWNSDVKLQEEFGGDADAFLATERRKK